MRLGVLYFIAMILTACAFAPAAAHLVQLPERLALSDLDYLFLQRIDGGGAMYWLLVAGALVADVMLVFLYRRRPQGRLVSLAAVFMALAVLVGFLWIYPAARETAGWTLLPADWQQLRGRWEYAQATNAVLIFLSLCVLILAAPSGRRRPVRQREFPLGLLDLR